MVFCRVFWKVFFFSLTCLCLFLVGATLLHPHPTCTSKQAFTRQNWCRVYTTIWGCAVCTLGASLRRPLAFAPCHLPARRRRCRTIDNCRRNHTPSPCHPLIDQQGSRMLQGDLCPEPELTKTLPSGLEMRGVTTPDRLLARLLGGLGRFVWSAPIRTC